MDTNFINQKIIDTISQEYQNSDDMGYFCYKIPAGTKADINTIINGLSIYSNNVSIEFDGCYYNVIILDLPILIDNMIALLDTYRVHLQQKDVLMQGISETVQALIECNDKILKLENKIEKGVYDD